MKAIVIDTGGGSTAQSSAPLPSAGADGGEHLLRRTIPWLQRSGVGDVLLLLQDPGSLAGVIGPEPVPGLRVQIAEAPAGQGTAGMLAGQTESFLDGTVLVIYSHLLIDVDLGDLVDYHRSRQALVTVGLRHTDDPAAEFMVECNSAGLVTQYVEHPASWNSEQRTAAAGIYLVEPDALRGLPAARPFDLDVHLLPLLVTRRAAIYGQLLDGTIEVLS